MSAQRLIKKSMKLVCLLTFMGLVTLGLSGLAMADAPAPAAHKAVHKGKGINYPAYLYAKGPKARNSTYKAYVRPAKGYNFKLVPLASKHYVPEW